MTIPRVDGVVDGRVIGTYLHGPVLSRNPELADLLLALGHRLAAAGRAQRLRTRGAGATHRGGSARQIRLGRRQALKVSSIRQLSVTRDLTCAHGNTASTSGVGEPGRFNAITDVPGVGVGHATIVEGDGPLVIGKGPVRTGVTVILPHDGQISREPVFAGHHRLNGFGELTGLSWVRESGLLTTPIAITNTNSIGTVRDAVVAHEIAERGDPDLYIGLPVVGETWDGILNDIRGQHVDSGTCGGGLRQRPPRRGRRRQCRRRNRHAVLRLQGRLRHGVPDRSGCAAATPTRLACFVQANHGERRHFQVNGVPVGAVIDRRRVPFPRLPESATGRQLPGGTGSVIVVAATDAPLLPHQLDRLAQRAGSGRDQVRRVRPELQR